MYVGSCHVAIDALEGKKYGLATHGPAVLFSCHHCFWRARLSTRLATGDHFFSFYTHGYTISRFWEPWCGAVCFCQPSACCPGSFVRKLYKSTSSHDHCK